MHYAVQQVLTAPLPGRKEPSVTPRQVCGSGQNKGTIYLLSKIQFTFGILLSCLSPMVSASGEFLNAREVEIVNFKFIRILNKISYLSLHITYIIDR